MGDPRSNYRHETGDRSVTAEQTVGTRPAARLYSSLMRVLPTLIGVALVVAAVRLTASRPARSRVALALGGLLLGGAFLAYGLRAFDLPSFEEAVERLAEALGPWTYLLVALFAFLETGALVGLLVPGETVIIIGGILAGEGAVDLLPLIVVAWVAAVGGDTVSFILGHRLGRSFVLLHGPRVRVQPQHVERAERFFARHGGKAIALGRFIGVIRAIVPFLAGASHMRPRVFFVYDIPSAAAWVTLNVMLGYAVFASVSAAANVTKWVTYGLVILGLGVGIRVVARRASGARIGRPT